jgi:exopolyphosphatase / guanosine-5'-triphosphate,3'-diphosphate pyrophosphatase
VLTPQRSSELLALVDIGSNAVRCVLARLEARPGFEIELRHRAQTRLGASHTDMLPPPAVKTTLQSVRRFLKRVRRERGDVRTLAVATAAVRDASNRDVLLAPLAELGVREIRILSGAEEGRLGAEAASRALPIERGIVIDLGGGSLQVTPVEGGMIQESSSVPIGVARLLRRFLTSDPAHPSELVAMREEIRSQLRPVLRAAPPSGRAVISGGVANALAALALSHRDASSNSQSKLETHGCTLSQAEVIALRAWLEPMTLQGRASAPGVKPERADVIVVGAIVLEELLAVSGYPELTVSRTSVREGVLWHEAAKLQR